MSGWNVGLGAAARKGCEEKQQKKKKKKEEGAPISHLKKQHDYLKLRLYFIEYLHTLHYVISKPAMQTCVKLARMCTYGLQWFFEDRSSKSGGLNIYYTFYFTTSHSWTQTIATSSRRQGWLHMSGCLHRHASLLKSGLKQIKRMAKVTGQMRELSFRVPIRIEMEAVVRWWVKGAERDKKKLSHCEDQHVVVRVLEQMQRWVWTWCEGHIVIKDRVVWFEIFMKFNTF